MSVPAAPSRARAVRLVIGIALLLNVGLVGAISWFGRSESRHPPTVLDRIRDARGKGAVVSEVVRLDLSGMQLSEQDIMDVGTLTTLRQLNLSRTNIKDDQLPHLAGLGALEEFDLSHTEISDAGAGSLQELGNLRVLELGGSKVTPGRVRELYAKMPGIRAHLYGAGAGVSGNVIYPALGKVVLLRYGKERLAFMFTALSQYGDGGAKFRWCLLQGASTIVDQGAGVVFEKYRQVKGEDGKEWVQSVGGIQSLLLTTVKVEGRRPHLVKLYWTRPLTVYFPYPWDETPPVQMALTPWGRFEDIDFDNPLLLWHTAPQQK